MHKNLINSNLQIVGNYVFVPPQGKPGMLFIHADWCGHCRRFIPTFHEIGSEIGNDFACLAIESKELSDKLSNALGVKYFPTIKFFDKTGRIIGTFPENEARTKQNLLNYICKVYHHCALRK